MTTSGTSVWNLDILDIIEDAYERAGLSARTGYDYRTARRSLNIISAEWSNRGLNLWTVEGTTLTLNAGVKDYTLPSDTIDMIEQMVRVYSQGSQLDYTIERIGVGDYASIPNKATTGRPLQIYVQRTLTPTFTVWPVPDQSYTLLYWRMKRIEDATTGTDTMDMPVRFVPAITAALAFYLAQKRPEAANRLQFLQTEYERQFALAADEDRGRESARFVPWIGYP